MAAAKFSMRVGLKGLQVKFPFCLRLRYVEDASKKKVEKRPRGVKTICKSPPEPV